MRKLANFVEKPENQQYYLNLQAQVNPEEDGFTETEDEDNSSGAEHVFFDTFYYNRYYY